MDLKSSSSRNLLHIVVLTICIVLLIWWLLFFGTKPEFNAQVNVDDKLLREQEIGNMNSEWLSYSRTFNGHRYSPLNQINRDSVKNLDLAWVYSFPPLPKENYFGRAGSGKLESTPIVVNGMMFITSANNRVFALDAKTGQEIWRRSEPMPNDIKGCCGAMNRGVAVYKDKVYWKTFDNRMQCLDAATGTLVWEVTIDDYKNGNTSTGAPLAADGKILTGIAGWGPGFIAAYDAETGDLVWKTYTAPQPNTEAAKTWGGATPIGASPWTTGTYDSELGLIYWGVGNPSPGLNGDGRPGDNLFSDSIVALDIKTGKMRWYYQVIPHDVWDYDAIGTPVLFDAEIAGKMRKLLFQANRAGYFLVLDRVTGEFILGKPYLDKITWAKGLDSEGRPIIDQTKVPTAGMQPVKVSPRFAGGSNWPPPAYNPVLKLAYFYAHESELVFNPPDSDIKTGIGDILESKIIAVDVTTGEQRWKYIPRIGNIFSGMLATGGGLLFSGDMNSDLFALDSETGKVLWQYRVPGVVISPVVTYMLDGFQYISVSVGMNTHLTFKLRNN
jgi:alcohol dehydrogenase (cytochrome c)